MHRKSLEAAHQLTSGDESNKDNDDDEDGGHSSGDENGEPKNRQSPVHKKTSANQATPSQVNYTASYQINGRAAVDDFRMNSVAELRAKAAEHHARLASLNQPTLQHPQPQHPPQQQQQQPQREGEFLISSDSSSSF